MRPFQNPTSEMIKNFLDGIQNNDISKMEELIQNGLDVNFNYSTLTPYYETYLVVAIENNKKQASDFLLEKGAIPNARAIEYTLNKNDWDFSRKLIQHTPQIQFNLNVLFKNDVPPNETNRILDAIIQSGTDLDQLSIDPNMPVLLYPIRQNNTEGFLKLIKNGVGVHPPTHDKEPVFQFSYDLLVLMSKNSPVYPSLNNALSSQIDEFIQNPVARNLFVKNYFLRSLDALPYQDAFINYPKKDLDQMIEHKNALKRAIGSPAHRYSPSVFKKTLSAIRQISKNATLTINFATPPLPSDFFGKDPENPKKENVFSMIPCKALEIPFHKHLENMTRELVAIGRGVKETFIYEVSDRRISIPRNHNFPIERLRDFTKHRPEMIPQFLSAIEKGDLPKVSEWTREGLDLNINYNRNFPFAETFLHKAFLSNRKEISNFLLGKGAIPNTRTIELLLQKEDYDDAIQLIGLSHDLKLDVKKIFNPNIPLAATNKILDAIIQTGTDITQLSMDPNVPILICALQQRNGEGMEKLITNGVQIGLPNDPPEIQQFLLQLMILSDIRPSTNHLLQNIVQNPNHQTTIMRENILELLDNFPRHPSFSNVDSQTFKKIIEKKDALKAEILNPKDPYTLEELHKVQLRINHMIHHPSSKISMTASSILDKNRVRPSSQALQTNLFSDGLPQNISSQVEREANQLDSEKLNVLSPLFQKVENLSQLVADGRKKRAVLYDYTTKRARIELQRNL
jgi:hypothetical protein